MTSPPAERISWYVFLRQNLGTIALLSSIIGGFFFLYFQIQFVIDRVNPTTIAEWTQKQAKASCSVEAHARMDDIRWCVLAAESRGELFKCLK